MRRYGPYLACRRSRIRYRLPFQDTQDSQRLVMRHSLGPGMSAKGCHGDKRYPMVVAHADSMYVDDRPTAVLKACAWKEAECRKAM